MSNLPLAFDEWYVKSSYQQFVQREGVPLYEGSALEDLINLPLGGWERRGGKAAYTRMGSQETNNLQIVEIPPKEELKPERHTYDAAMFVLKGKGATTVWQEGEPQHTVEWQEGSLLAIPLNAWHQEFNGSSNEPSRIVFGTNMAQVINFYRNLDFVFNNPFCFRERYSHSTKDFFSEPGTRWKHRSFETNFIPDIKNFELDPFPERGLRMAQMRISMASTSLGIHINSVSEGTYVTAHRHAAGAHVIPIQGEGYAVLFWPGEENNRRQVPFRPYTVVSPKNNEFHQFFNTGKGPLRWLGFTLRGWRYGFGKEFDPNLFAQDKDPHAEAFKLRYDREDPKLREEYYQELENNGIHLRLSPLDQGSG